MKLKDKFTISYKGQPATISKRGKYYELNAPTLKAPLTVFAQLTCATVAIGQVVTATGDFISWIPNNAIKL
jgi:hypothetical protein